MKTIKTTLLVLATVFIIAPMIMCGGLCAVGTGTMAVVESARVANQANSAEGSGEPTPPVVHVWEYTETEDPLTGQATRLACVRSTEDSRVNLAFPYNSTRHARLCVRNHPQHGTDVYLSTLGDSQILCTSRRSGGCSVQVRFDEGSVQSVSGNPSSSHSTNIVFLSSRVLREIKNSEVMRVQVDFYNHGNHTFVFNTTGLELEE